MTVRYCKNAWVGGCNNLALTYSLDAEPGYQK